MLRCSRGELTLTIGAGSTDLGLKAGVGSGVSKTADGVDTGAAAGAGTFAETVLLIAGEANEEAVGGAEGAAPKVISPLSRLTSFGGAVLPEKNSLAESAGSADGAGG